MRAAQNRVAPVWMTSAHVATLSKFPRFSIRLPKINKKSNFVDCVVSSDQSAHRRTIQFSLGAALIVSVYGRSLQVCISHISLNRLIRR